MNLNLLKKNLTFVIILIGTYSYSAYSQVGTTTINVSEDVYVSEQSPDANTNGEIDMGVAIDNLNHDGRETYLKFDISDLYGKGGLVDARLSIMASVKNEAPWTTIPDFYLDVYGCSAPWNESTITWNNRPAPDPDIIAQGDIQQAARYEISGTSADSTTLMNYITEALTNKLQFVSFVLKGQVETPGSRIWISDMQWEPAKLIVTQDYGLDDPSWVSVYVDEISISGENNETSINTDNGTLQLIANVSPEDADNKRVKWTVINKTGKATISSTGLLTGLANGTVDVIAAAVDGGWTESEPYEFTITGQNYNWDERNVIVDGAVTHPGFPWVGNAVFVDGIAELDSPVAGNYWDYALQQIIKIPYENKNLDYIFSLKAWASEDRPINVNFYDAANGYVNLGSSSDPGAIDGRSNWDFNISTLPQFYEFHVKFDALEESSEQWMSIMAGMAAGTVYIDSISLITKEDYILKTGKLDANSIKIYPNPVGDDGELIVSMIAENEKVTIYNLIGQVMMEQIAHRYIAKFNVRTLKKGIYIAKLSDGSSLKFIK